MSWLDNLIGAFWVLLQIILWIGLIALTALVVGAVLHGVWKNLKRSKEPSKEFLMNLAEAAAISQYRRAADIGDKVDTFVAGADYVWEHLHPKK